MKGVWAARDTGRRPLVYARLKVPSISPVGESFGGWFLPTEVANFQEMFPEQGISWVSQLNEFTRQLSAYCTELAPGLVAIAPYFDSKNP
jgi:hypothetical protein